MDFYPVRPLHTFGTPTLRTTAKELTITFPAALASHLKLARDTQVDVLLGRDSRNRAAAVRIAPSSNGAYCVKAAGRSLQIRIPELRPREENLTAQTTYVLEDDGSVTISLPSPWDLAQPDAIAKEKVAPRLQPPRAEAA